MSILMALKRSLASRSRRLAKASVLAVGLAGTLFPSLAWGQNPTARSVSDLSPRPSDELARPREREKWSHRGYQVKGEHLEVVATTGAADARWAMQEAEAAWKEMSILADHLTNRHRHPDFGLGAVQIAVDGEPRRERNEGAALVQLVGSQTSVDINTASGEPSLEKQRLRLRQAVAWSLLRRAEVDRYLPAAACEGLAAYAAKQGLNSAELQAAQAGAVALPNSNAAKMPFGSQIWRGERTGRNQLTAPVVDGELGASQVQFLLEAYDGAYAPQFFAVLQSEFNNGLKEATQTTGRLRSRPGEIAPQAASAAYEQLLSEHQVAYQAWQKDPAIGQPKLAEELSANPKLAEKQAEMLLVLKLLRRFSNPQASSLHVRVNEFQVGQGNTTKNSFLAKPYRSMRDFSDHLTDPRLPMWATIDTNGRLLFSDNTLRIAQMVGANQYRYELGEKKTGYVLTEKLAPKEFLKGWLEEDPKNPDRPIAKFAFVADAAEVAAVPKPPAEPAAQPATEAEPEASESSLAEPRDQAIR